MPSYFFRQNKSNIVSSFTFSILSLGVREFFDYHLEFPFAHITLTCIPIVLFATFLFVTNGYRLTLPQFFIIPLAHSVLYTMLNYIFYIILVVDHREFGFMVLIGFAFVIYLLNLAIFGTLHLVFLFIRHIFPSKNRPPIKSDAVLSRYITRTNILASIIGFLLSMGGVLYCVNFLNYKAPMPYASWREIEPYDFRGLKRPDIHVDSKYDYATIKSEFEVVRDNEKIVVTTYFFPSRSYVFSDKEMTIDLLLHELYHLHVTEIGARLLRKEITSYYGLLPNSKLKEMVACQLKIVDSLQTEYDNQSNHSLNQSKQEMWENIIDSCLVSLTEYSNPVIVGK